MGYLAQLIFTISLCQIPVETKSLSPFVTWYFSSASCEVCFTRQIELAQKYISDNDLIVFQESLYQPSDTQKNKEYFRKAFPRNRLVGTQDTSNDMITGWIWQDPVSGESVRYNSCTGIYNYSRSKSLLLFLVRKK